MTTRCPRRPRLASQSTVSASDNTRPALTDAVSLNVRVEYRRDDNNFLLRVISYYQ
jgi:hypothetical protein